MRSLVVLFLSTTSVLAADYQNYNGRDQSSNGNSDTQSYVPMDYYDDDFFKQNINVKPESTFTFNFEQTRRDQPPQLEMREENVGRYFPAKPTTTTSTTPASIFSMKVNSEAQHVYPKMNAMNSFGDQAWNNIQASSVPPPPRFAFSRSTQLPQGQFSPQYNNPEIQRAPENYRSRNYNIQPRTSAIQTTSAAPITLWTDRQAVQNRNIYVPTPAPQIQSPFRRQAEPIRFAPSASYVSDSITGNKQQLHRNAPNRGSHKFSWDDIKNEQQEAIPVEIQPRPTMQPMPITVQSSTGQPLNMHKAPPSYPTLSPWYDGFGK